MKASIQTKLLVMCIFLVLLTTAGISATYYILTRQDKHRESQQRIQIAFDIIFNDFAKRLSSYTTRFDEFLREDTKLRMTTFSYLKDETRISSSSFILNYLVPVVDELQRFGHLISLDLLALYGTDTQQRLLAVYQRDENEETVGVYVVSEEGNDTYLPITDPSQSIAMLAGTSKFSDTPLPPGIAARYEDDIPETISTSWFQEGQKLGLRIIAPIYNAEEKTGVLVGEMFYTQAIVEEYASLSKTAINLFAGDQFSIGTFPAQMYLSSETIDQMIACEDILNENITIDVAPLSFGDQGYYQGQCVFRNTQDVIGALTVSLSQEIEQEEIRKIFTAVLTISGIVCSIAFGLSVIFSRKTIRSIHNIVRVIGSATEGDLRPTAIAVTRDEIGMLARKLNQMIAQLRDISGRVQAAALAVNGTADTILQQMDILIRHMEQQSSSVENTTDSVEKVTRFIEVVAQNTTELLSAAALILSSIQLTRANIDEVTSRTGDLTADLHLISSSVDQVNQSVKQISQNTGQLVEIAQQTETEIRHIDQSFRDVSHNADQTQQLAKETMDAALQGQASVEASLHGMTELKEVVTDTARIIQEVSSWGEQVSAILDIVDDITEQTSLLSLNASIISAQAGVHGRGFAVVADEIKELAVRTKASTKEIGTLVHELRVKTGEGVKNTAEGIAKADQGMELANAVKASLNTILERATRSSNRAADTAQVIQQTADSSRIISTSMQSVTEMVAQIRGGIQESEQDIEQVVTAVENISGMAEQVNRASVEQKNAAEEIERSMELVTERFENTSNQTEELKHSSQQIVTAMRTVKSTTDQILQDVTSLSGETIKNLLHESDTLQQIVNVFKVT